MHIETGKAVLPARRLLRLSAGAVSAVIFCLPFSKALAEVAIAVAISCWLLEKILVPDREFVKRGAVVLAALYLLASIPSFVLSPLPPETVRGFVKLLKHLLLFCVVVDLASHRTTLKGMLLAVLAAFLMVTLNGLAQAALSRDLLRGRVLQFTNVHLRVSSSFDVPTKYGIYLVFFVPALAILALRLPAGRLKLAALGALGLGVVNLMLTHARGSWLGAGVVIMLACFVFRRYGLILLAVLFALRAWQVMPSTFFLHGSVVDREQSGGDRLVLWQRALDVIRANPLTGCGINTYVRRHALFDRVDDPRVQGYYPHSSYLHIGAEQGLIALAAFMALLLFVLVKLWRKSKRFPDLRSRSILHAWSAGLLSMAIVAGLDNVVHTFETGLHFWIMLGIGYGMTLSSEAAPLIVAGDDP